MRVEAHPFAVLFKVMILHVPCTIPCDSSAFQHVLILNSNEAVTLFGENMNMILPGPVLTVLILLPCNHDGLPFAVLLTVDTAEVLIRDLTSGHSCVTVVCHSIQCVLMSF